MPPVHILVFCTTEYAGRTFAPGVHLVTGAEALSLYICGAARPATQAELADSRSGAAASTGKIESAVLSSTGEHAVSVRTRSPRQRAQPAVEPAGAPA